MKRLLVVGCLVLTASLTGQVEHAPTVAQCQADQRLWFSKLENLSQPLPKFDVLSEWDKEMADCSEVDPTNHWKYYNIRGEIGATNVVRMRNFLERHQLWNKFLYEDEAGER